MRRLFEEEKPIVTTKYGKVRGFTYGGVNTFLGIRYAKAKRFCEPEDPDCFEGIFEADTLGPQMRQMRPFSPYAYERGINRDLPQSEDCQVLNVWAAKGGKKMPVIVWMHGGGFFSGHSLAANCYDGLNMAHKGNMVFVSMNHRLNLMGHLNLSEYGEQFANSVNLGISDLVAALKWVHENIEAFGGDPENVTICGHSGGGGKVMSLYQVEAAKDYFARGICMSGCLDNGPETDEKSSLLMAKALMDELKITKENIEKIYTIPYDEILEAYNRIVPELDAKGIGTGMSPVKNHWFKGFPEVEGFCEWSKDKPLMISSTISEFNFKVRISDYEKAAMTEADKIDRINARFGADAPELLELFKKAYPDHDILDLMYYDADFRRPSYASALKKAEVTGPTTYMYLFAVNMPTDGRVPAWHGADISFAFCNAEMIPVSNEPVYGERISNVLENAYINFCRCGDPNNEYLPEWKPFTLDGRYTMVIDRTYDELREAYDEELVALYKKACPPLNFRPDRKSETRA